LLGKKAFKFGVLALNENLRMVAPKSVTLAFDILQQTFLFSISGAHSVEIKDIDCLAQHNCTLGTKRSFIVFFPVEKHFLIFRFTVV